LLCGLGLVLGLQMRVYPIWLFRPNEHKVLIAQMVLNIHDEACGCSHRPIYDGASYEPNNPNNLLWQSKLITAKTIPSLMAMTNQFWSQSTEKQKLHNSCNQKKPYNFNHFLSFKFANLNNFWSNIIYHLNTNKQY